MVNRLDPLERSVLYLILGGDIVGSKAIADFLNEGLDQKDQLSRNQVKRIRRSIKQKLSLPSGF